jgi:hypothetical protein
MTRTPALFSSASIEEKRAEAESAIRAAVDRAPVSSLSDPDALAGAVTRAFAPHPPVLLREAIGFRVFEDVVEVENAPGHSELRTGVTAELHVPFLGPADYFRLWAATLPTHPPLGRIEGRALVLVMSTDHPDGKTAQRRFGRDLDRIDGMLDEQRRYCDDIRPALQEVAAASIEARRIRLAAVSAISARLVAEGYAPLRQRRPRRRTAGSGTPGARRSMRPGV